MKSKSPNASKDAQSVKNAVCKLANMNDFTVIAVQALVASLNRQGCFEDAANLWQQLLDRYALKLNPDC